MNVEKKQQDVAEIERLKRLIAQTDRKIESLRERRAATEGQERVMNATMKKGRILPWVGIGLGILAVLSGVGLNWVIVLLGTASIILGWLALREGKRNLAWWSVGLSAFALLGYLGIVGQRMSP